MPLSDADTRSKLIDPALYACGWTEDLIRREETAGSIAIVDGMVRKQSPGPVDYTIRVKVNSDSQSVAVALIEAEGREIAEALVLPCYADSAEQPMNNGARYMMGSCTHWITVSKLEHGMSTRLWLAT
jgi:hypothetical protein